MKNTGTRAFPNIVIIMAELCHLVEDPREDCNRVADPACGDVLARMRARLEEWFLQYALPARDGARQAVTGRGQIDMVEAGNRGRPAFVE